MNQGQRDILMVRSEAAGTYVNIGNRYRARYIVCGMRRHHVDAGIMWSLYDGPQGLVLGHVIQRPDGWHWKVTKQDTRRWRNRVIQEGATCSLATALRRVAHGGSNG